MRAIILTKSVMGKKDKYGNTEYYGSCVTALNEATLELVRFVAAEDGSPIHNEIADNFNRLDLVEVDIQSPCPKGPQQENLLVKEEDFKVKGHCSSGETFFKLYNNMEHPEGRFMDDTASKMENVSQYRHSIEIVQVNNLRIFLNRDNGKNSPKATFDIGSKSYSGFSVTDKKYRLCDDDTIYKWYYRNAYLVISIPTHSHIDGMYYKFVAAVYPQSREAIDRKAGYCQEDHTQKIIDLLNHAKESNN